MLFPYLYMEKQNDLTMEIKRETAMKLWAHYFGNEIKAKDFSGREIAKGAYNDRNSKFGWNVDHILPQRQGGKSTQSNLIVCNVKTNDEKADKFPGFVANGKRFTIIKVDNHYEIKPEKKTEDNPQKSNKVDFFDHSSALSFYKEFKGFQNKKRTVGTIAVVLRGISGADTAVTDFIEELFYDEDVSFADGVKDWNHDKADVAIVIKANDILNESYIDVLLDKCVLLNTYLGRYFVPLKIITAYNIFFRLDTYQNRKDFFVEDKNIKFLDPSNRDIKDTLFLNTSAVEKSYAKGKIGDDVGHINNDDFHVYNYEFVKLAENLKKEVEGK